mmetsp:Transcript_4107/g.7527  ORF Transcript_4107/g.7527 Transcript_4107/m.7527 type:complete len:286 (-) Transcript_4107:251-1108(-)
MTYPAPFSHSRFRPSGLRHDQERICPWEDEAARLLQCYKPKCIVLDLDFTLWPTFFSAHTLPPYIPLNDHPSQVLCVDKKTHKPRLLSLYPEVLHTIQFCLNNDIMISVASKNSNRDDAYAILRSLGLWHRLHCPQIFHNRKTYHFRNLKSITHFNYNDFMFFDDDIKNVAVCNNIGVRSYRVDRATGFNGKALVRALRDCVTKHLQQEGSPRVPAVLGLHDSQNMEQQELQEEMAEAGESERARREKAGSGGAVPVSAASSTDSSDNDEAYCIDCDTGGGMFCI